MVMDRIWLLVCGLIAASGAAIFWYTAGENGALVLNSAVLIGLAFENKALKKKLKGYESK
ncbi:hypothetical protein A9Q99_06130 [Gammaproteobacteria bacterium 45_16_T64]|nr:hypothetical protein A9Q99_06130 [Gammaproteobacteria bacterium 45_16_T64]